MFTSGNAKYYICARNTKPSIEFVSWWNQRVDEKRGKIDSRK